ncbi:MAG: reductive dehalogenase [Chloroflexi bacterium]|nr:reductive dehalogenase [Chloroflexota bacterium]
MSYNLTRREFLKDLGLLGAGVTLAPVAAQGETFESFVERSDPGWKPGPAVRPAWVKTIDKPTTEIDWDKKQRWDERNTAFNFPKYFGDERLKKLQTIQAENTARYLKEGRPGYTLKDLALMAGANLRAFANVSGLEFPFLGPDVLTPEKRGAPKFTASPEEAAKIVATALRFYGAGSVGFVELDPKTTQKLIFSHDGDGKMIEFADVEQPQETKEKRIIPNKCRYAIVFTVQMSVETQKRAPTPTGAATTYIGYEFGGLIQTRIQAFLKSLGYHAPGEYSRNALGLSVGLGVMAGLGELARFNRLLTPEYGPTVRVFKLLTDLPLAPTKPIDAGFVQFCKVCKKCADACPSKAVSFDDEPSWQVRGEYNSVGHKAWFDDAVKCRAYWFEAGTGCAACFAACPFATKDKATFHQLVKFVSSNAPGLGGVVRSLDDLLYGAPGVGGKPIKDPNEWWSLDMPEYGIDTAKGKRDV